jgi:hypothetical protein
LYPEKTTRGSSVAEYAYRRVNFIGMLRKGYLVKRMSLEKIRVEIKIDAFSIRSC